MPVELTYSEYNDKSFVVRGDRDTYSTYLKRVKGRWNNKLRDGPGWIVNKEKREQLEELIEQLNNLEQIEHNTKSRKTQSRFHRADSIQNMDDLVETVVEQKQDKEEDSQHDDTSSVEKQSSHDSGSVDKGSPREDYHDSGNMDRRPPSREDYHSSRRPRQSHDSGSVGRRSSHEDYHSSRRPRQSHDSGSAGRRSAHEDYHPRQSHDSSNVDRRSSRRPRQSHDSGSVSRRDNRRSPLEDKYHPRPRDKKKDDMQNDILSYYKSFSRKRHRKSKDSIYSGISSHEDTSDDESSSASDNSCTIPQFKSSKVADYDFLYKTINNLQNEINKLKGKKR